MGACLASLQVQVCNSCLGNRVHAHSSVVTAAPMLERPTGASSADRFVQPHLVLHFDVNKTIVMVDTIQGIPPGDVLNGILAESSWGRLIEGSNGDLTKGWQLASPTPSPIRPRESPELLSYLEYLEQRLPGKAKDVKKQREKVWKQFTEPGQPGESLRPVYEQLQASLRGEGRMVGTRMVIPAFFELIAELVKQGRRFSVVFRTFGSDLPVVQAEFNAFCAGKHPKYLGLRLDGSGDGPDLRMVPENTGSWYRDSTDFSIVWGTTTLEEDLKAAGGDLGKFLAQPDNAHLQSRRGLAAVLQDLSDKTSKPCVLGLRDYFPYWQQGGQHGPFGKPLLVDTRDHHRHCMFFDDNILLDDQDTKIVDVRDKSGKALWPVYAQRYYICRAEPLLAISDDRYYIRKVEELEKKFHTKRVAMMRLKAATLTVTAMIRAGSTVFDVSGSAKQTYDAWKQARTSIMQTHFSSSTVEAEV